jgi:transposase
LLHKLTPDCKTIADFRQEHAQALKGVCRACTILCKTLDLFGRALMAIDGSQCKAVKKGNIRNCLGHYARVKKHSYR